MLESVPDKDQAGDESRGGEEDEAEEEDIGGEEDEDGGGEGEDGCVADFEVWWRRGSVRIWGFGMAGWWVGLLSWLIFGAGWGYEAGITSLSSGSTMETISVFGTVEGAKTDAEKQWNAHVPDSEEML